MTAPPRTAAGCTSRAMHKLVTYRRISWHRDAEHLAEMLETAQPCSCRLATFGRRNPLPNGIAEGLGALALDTDNDRPLVGCAAMHHDVRTRWAKEGVEEGRVFNVKAINLKRPNFCNAATLK